MSAGSDSYAAPPPNAGMFPGQQQDSGASEMTDAELERIFRHFDEDGSGSIDADELRQAMQALGIKVTQSSCKKVLAMIDSDNNGTIEWEEFYAFFEKVRDPEGIKDLLASANQRYLDYKMMVQGDPSFEKRFFVPPVLKYDYKYNGHEDNVEDLCWLNNTDPYFISCSLDGSIKIWDASTGKFKENVVSEYESGIYCITVLQEGKKVISGHGSTDKNVCLWDVTGKNQLQVYTGQSAPVYCTTSEKNVKTETNFVTGAKNGKMCFYSIEKAEPVCVMDEIHEGVVYSVDLNDDCTTLCSASSDGQVQLTDLRAATSGRVKNIQTVEDAAASGVVYKALWRGEHEILSCGDDYCVKKWDLRNMKLGAVENYFGHTSPVRTICLSPCQKFMCSATDDGCIRLWTVDERLYIQQEKEANNSAIERNEARREKYDHLIYEGDDEIDEDGLKRVADDLIRNYKSSRKLVHVYHERDSMKCVQAKVGLDGHTLPVSAVSWRNKPDDDTKIQICSGAQDMVALSYELNKPVATDFVKWNKELQVNSPEEE